MAIIFSFLFAGCTTFYKAWELSKAGNYQQAMQWYLKAADEGNSSAMWNIGVMYHHGQGVPQNTCKAFEWYRKSVAHGEGGKFKEYFEANEKAYTQNICMASEYFSKAYKFDQVKDYSQAMQWYLKAAELGDTSAMGNIGVHYDNGWGVSADNCKGHEWEIKAANQENAFFQINVGDNFRYGRCNSIDLATAEKWYKAALENKNASDEVREYARKTLKSLQEEKVQKAKEEELAQVRREQDRVEEHWRGNANKRNKNVKRKESQTTATP